MTKPAIKVKAMGLFVSEDRRFLASQGFDSVKGQSYLRLLGGHVEFGEHSEETVRRELREEISADIRILALLEVVENTFVFEGRPGHEIVFVYAAELTDPSFYSRDNIPVIEPGSPANAVWTPCQEVLDGRAWLYPPANYAAHFAQKTGVQA